MRLVIDLKACKPANLKIQALADHDPSKVIGYWDNFEFSSEGVFADLHLMKPASAVEAELLPEAVKTAAYIRDGVPIQVSVGAQASQTGSWELVEGKVQANGREYDGAGDIPLYLLCGGELTESSVVTFGADGKTGQLAAKQLKSPVIKEATMSDKLKDLLGKFAEKHHGLVARCVAENLDESAITIKVHASEMEEKDAALKAANDEIAGLKAKLSEYEAEEGDKKKDEDDAKEAMAAVAEPLKGFVGAKRTVKFGASDDADAKAKAKGGAPKVTTMTQAMKVTAEKDPTLKGFALRKAARAAFPDAEEK